MAYKSFASVSLFLAFNILFFSLVSASGTNCPPPPKPKPSCPPPPKSKPTPSIPKTPYVPTPSVPKTPSVPTPSSPKTPSVPTPTSCSTGSCSRDTLKLGVCGKLLGGVVGVVLGSPSKSPCCTLLQGLADLDATVCLCTAIKANILGININVPISLSVLLNACGYMIPSGFKCMKKGSPISSTLEKKLQKKSAFYDDDMVYWESDVELRVHKSGMCFDNKNKIYFKPIDYKKGDLRPLYYRESSGDFTLAVTGVPRQSNKKLLKIKDWNRDAIYNVKSSDYKPGLINLFNDSFARIVRGEEQPVVLTPSSEM